MQRDELMRQFADVVGFALAKRWLAQALALGKERTESTGESIGKDEAGHPHNSAGIETQADCERAEATCTDRSTAGEDPLDARVGHKFDFTEARPKEAMSVYPPQGSLAADEPFSDTGQIPTDRE